MDIFFMQSLAKLTDHFEFEQFVDLVEPL